MEISIYNIAQKYKDKIWAKVDRRNGDLKCWEWTSVKTEKGYGRYSIYPNRAQYAHRLVWVLCGNLIPSELVLDHICKNRGCVNPNHLRLVTLRQNTLENSDSISAKNLKRSGCKNGHPYTKSNLQKTSKYRRCVKCQKINEKNRRKRDWKRSSPNYGKVIKAEGGNADDFFNKLQLERM